MRPGLCLGQGPLHVVGSWGSGVLHIHNTMFLLVATPARLSGKIPLKAVYAFLSLPSPCPRQQPPLSLVSFPERRYSGMFWDFSVQSHLFSCKEFDTHSHEYASYLNPLNHASNIRFASHLLKASPFQHNQLIQSLRELPALISLRACRPRRIASYAMNIFISHWNT